MMKRKSILLIPALILLTFSIKTAHSQEQTNISADVPDSAESRLSESQLSTLTTDKTRVAVGEIATLKLSLVGINRQLIPNRNVSLSYYVSGKKIGEVKGVTDLNGISLARVASENKLKTDVIAYDESREPPLKISSGVTLDFSGNQGKQPNQDVDLMLSTKENITSLSLFDQVIVFFRRLLGLDR